MADFTARKIFKQMYPATYNFKDDAVADDPDGWTISQQANCDISVIASWQGHKKVLKLYDNSAVANNYARQSFTGTATGTIEFFGGAAQTDKNCYYSINDGAWNVCIWLRLASTGQIQRIDNLGVWQNIQAYSANTFYHFRVEFDCAADWHLWIDGVSIDAGAGYPFYGVPAAMDYFNIITDNATSDFTMYLDALGYSWDTDYNIGDNVFWRHYKETTTDTFEEDDVGTQGTSITWVDAVNNADDHEIVPYFNEHKKVLRTYQNSGTGEGYHTFASQAKTGLWESWIAVADVTEDNRIRLSEDATDIVAFRINASQFQIYTAAAWRQVTSSPAAVNATWYHLKIQWYDAATDTFDLWIDNVLYEAGTNCANNQTAGINRNYVEQQNAGVGYIYIDAPTSSLDTDAIANNRTLDYLAYSYNDITSTVFECRINDMAYQPSTAFIKGATTLSLDANHFIQLYDVNGDLRFEGDYTQEVQASLMSGFPLVSLNDDELELEVSYTASAAEDVNATLLGNFTNVGQVSGRFIYYTEDDPAGNLTPNYRNKPNYRVIRGNAIHGGKYAIIKANGVFMLDDDRNPAAGATTVSETTADIKNNPLIDIIDFQFNYVMVRGGIDPDTGTPFSGVSEDTTAQTASGIKRYYKRYRELQSDTDCQNRAINIRTGTGFSPTIITVQLYQIYALPGEIINFAYSHKSFSATNCYVESVSHNLVTGLSTYKLNTGIFDRASANEPGYTYADETSDDIAEALYVTDINTIICDLWEGGATTRSSFGMDIPQNSHVRAYFYIPSTVDTSRDIIITINFRSQGIVAYDGLLDVNKYDSDGADAGEVIENNLNFDITHTGNNTYNENTYTLATADISADWMYEVVWYNSEATNIYVAQIQVQYYIKRSV